MRATSATVKTTTLLDGNKTHSPNKCNLFESINVSVNRKNVEMPNQAHVHFNILSLRCYFYRLISVVHRMQSTGISTSVGGPRHAICSVRSIFIRENNQINKKCIKYTNT